ncbi:MAG: hypothetical protein RIM72_22340 [Alphaproteobacteria bacterium]
MRLYVFAAMSCLLALSPANAFSGLNDPEFKDSALEVNAVNVRRCFRLHKQELSEELADTALSELDAIDLGAKYWQKFAEKCFARTDIRANGEPLSGATNLEAFWAGYLLSLQLELIDTEPKN